MNSEDLLSNMNQHFSPKYLELNKRIVEVIDNFNLVQYVPLNIKDEESIDTIIQQIDSVVQYDEFKLPKESMLPREDFDDNEEAGDMEY